MRGVALLLTAVTGFSGLVYEVAWEKCLATLLGSDSEAAAAVLGLFLGGLALGYALFGAITRRRVERARASGQPPRLLLFYGFLEAGIGVYALGFPFFFKLVQSLSFLIPHGGGGPGFALDVALSGLLIGPPAVLMGGTIPILTQALARSLADATRFHAFVVAFNAAGAFAGALSAGFWLVPALGLVGVLVAMGLVNLFVGATFVALGLRAPATPAPEEAERSPVAPPRPSAFAAAALLLGFAMMTLQTVLIRLGALSFGSSPFTFSMVVAVFVLCIALGSFAVSALPRIPKSLLVCNLWALLALLCLLHLELEDAPYWTHALRSLFRTESTAFYPYHLTAFLCVLAVIGLPVALSGATLPLIFHQLRRETGELGDVAGRLYSWNTLGSLLGALLGGYALLFWLDLDQVSRAATAALAVGAALVTLRIGVPRRRAAAGLLFAAGLGAIAALPTWSPERLSAGLFRMHHATPHTFAGPDFFFANHAGGQLLSYEDGPTASVAVKQTRSNDGRVHRNIVTNGKSDGAIWQDYVTMGLLALLPALLAEPAESAFVVGYGTGVTAGELAALRSARAVDVAEISPAVIRARSFFDYGNQRASQNQKIRILAGDAYRTLLHSDSRYDVITSMPSNPWVTGIEMLYSREFLEAARHHLAPGGVHAQWFPLYGTDAASVAMVLRTYASVFEHVAVWYGKGHDLLLLGLRDPKTALDLDRLAARAARPDFADGLRRCEIGGLPELLAHELLPLGVAHATPLPGELHTLLRPRLSYLAARAFFTGGEAMLPNTAGLEAARRGFQNSLVRRYAERSGRQLPGPIRARLAREACRYRPDQCVALLAQWLHDAPNSPHRRRLQQEMREDPERASTVPWQLVASLSRLYGGEGPAVAEASAAQVAGQATAFFSRYYSHAAPFSRRALAEILNRCTGVPGPRRQCSELREQAEQMLGNLAVEVEGADASVGSGGA